MIEEATEAMEEIDLNADLTVVENILVEMIEIEVNRTNKVKGHDKGFIT